MKIYSFQTIGNRQRQEDSFYISSDNKLFALCDGVGGSNDGQLGSITVKNSINNSYKLHCSLKNSYDLKSIIESASTALYNTGYDNIATTLALLYLSDNKAYISHFGDTRIYFISKRNNKCFVTEDHSIVQELFKDGIIKTEEEMRKHPFRHMITKSLNSSKLLDYNSIEVETINDIESGDMFILCTDGVLENYNNEEIVSLFTDEAFDFESICKSLENTSRALSKDNSTAIIIEV